MNRLKTKLGLIELKNPITVASGTFGYEYNDFFDLNALGAIVTKTITPEPKAGNVPPRLFETNHGLLNSIGLQNPGVDGFLTTEIPVYEKYDTPIIVSFSAPSINGFCKTIEKLEENKNIAGYEVNVSCPNVENEGLAFGTCPDTVFDLTSKLKKLTNKELIIKLSPNVTDIATIAKAAEQGGATSIALINTLLGMAIDPQTGKSRLKRGVAGYSGPAIKPVALWLTYKVAKAIKIPILAMGGICNHLDALEFFYAGASAVAIGTKNFYNPNACAEIIKNLENYFDEKQINLTDIIGKVNGLAF